ncbi:flagellar protein FliT [Vibrio japonicus]|uniref:Flagellar protein FliT n=1 Tax=Vibrio japonicus TaxID=1824638 RepID=A0ABY5LCW6_9VIBR|nr:flagellar protein FliT [Vibrio japonicus]UUM29849.1 flagellar protein FliT [Vibrio japonicus]
MHLHSEFERYLTNLGDLNHNMKGCLASEELNTEEIARLVDTREQLLLKLLQLIRQDAQLVDSEGWQNAIHETQVITELMQNKTSEIALSLRKYQQGKRSVQQYKKFI